MAAQIRWVRYDIIKTLGGARAREILPYSRGIGASHPPRARRGLLTNFNKILLTSYLIHYYTLAFVTLKLSGQ